MCLGIPRKVLEVREENGLPMGRVDFGGVRKNACLAYLPEVKPGDYVIVHVGFAISRVDEEEALKTLELLSMMGDLVEQELATMGPDQAAPAVVDDTGPGFSGPPASASTLPLMPPAPAAVAPEPAAIAPGDRMPEMIR